MSQPSALPATTPSDEAPRCTICGKVAVRQDIDGAWWPPCEHAKANGLHTLQYPSEGSAPDTPTSPDEDAANIEGLIEVCEHLKAKLVPFGASGGNWDSVVETLRKCWVHFRPVPPSAPDTKPDERITEIRERLAKATPGPWEMGRRVEEPFAHYEEQHNVFPPLGQPGPIADVGGESNASFIAHAPEDIAYLLSRLSSSPPEGEDTQ